MTLACPYCQANNTTGKSKKIEHEQNLNGVLSFSPGPMSISFTNFQPHQLVLVDVLG